MPIGDVLSRMATIQQLADASLAPAAPSAAPSTSFADTLAAVDPTSTPGAAAQLATEAGLAPAAAVLGDGSGDPSSAAALARFGPSPFGSAAPATSSPLGTSTLPPWLAGATTAAAPTAAVAPDGTTVGQRALAAAETQVGVTEQPPGSNDGPALATYRAAVEGAEPGQPWCAEFASWAAAQAGEPLGDRGQGLASVAEIADWASSSGRVLPASATPQPGDLILFGDRHVGLVESVGADGTLTTVEGNYANAVSRVTRSPSEATGYVRL